MVEVVVGLSSDIIEEAFTGLVGYRRGYFSEDEDGKEEESSGEEEGPKVGKNSNKYGGDVDEDHSEINDA
ncbi:hypothetical protein TorRG33x02_011890 [Trema orientale]|uniref:Uncharacterized protein n=1 Tax=Trema orientale TaxID=63057 RepID=A0A2P5FZA9_TREOI|nr:hypothetical protein TorRG33x02_011890 [Trema orientale]